MSKHVLLKELKMELKKINADIDMKIIRGLSYRKEARRHKFIMAQISSLRDFETSIDWFGRMGKLVTTFMF